MGNERKTRKDVFLTQEIIKHIESIYGPNKGFSEFCCKAAQEKMERDKGKEDGKRK